MTSTILYAMNVPWSWIEQRPHIIASGLAKRFNVTAVSPRSLLKTLVHLDCTTTDFPGESRTAYYMPAFADKGVLHKLMVRENSRRCFYDCAKFDCLWFSHPWQSEYLPDSFSGCVVYDCMDDHIAMADASKRVSLAKQEKVLLDRADIVLVSSEYLKSKVGRDDAILVRNGYKENNLHPVVIPLRRNQCTIAYFGTVAQWFDFDAIAAVTNTMPDVRFRIIGPAEAREEIPGVEYVGAVEHAALYDAVADCSCLIMPFKVNSIVEAVDPVKLYEYIAFGKCVVSVRYPEIERFGDYVYFYETKEGLVSLIAELAERGFPPKYTESSRASFLEENTWERRVETIVATLEQYGVEPR